MTFALCLVSGNFRIALNNSFVASCVFDFSVVYQYSLQFGALVTVEVPHVGRLEAHTRARTGSGSHHVLINSVTAERQAGLGI